MAPIVSATTKISSIRTGRTRTREMNGQLRRLQFIAQAERLLEQARAYAGNARFEDALEVAYQAGLRTAGARIAVSKVAKRKRVPASAWDKMSLLGAEDIRWAKEFSQYSKIRERLISGMERVAPEETVYQLLELAGRFLADTQDGQFEQLAA